MLLCCNAVRVQMLSVIHAIVNYAECRKQAHYAECRCAVCRYAECRWAECRGAI
jgi:hypothetical protein